MKAILALCTVIALAGAVALYRAKWSPPLDRRVAEWLWEHRHRWVPVPQPEIAWAQRWQESRGVP